MALNIQGLPGQRKHSKNYLTTVKKNRRTRVMNDLDKQIERARQAWIEADKTEARATHAKYKDGNIYLLLRDKTQVEIRADLIEGLRGAEPSLIKDLHIGSKGASIHWPALDVDMSVDGLVKGVYGTKKWMELIKQENKNASR